jgi:signal transduction histidine kinase
MLMLCSVTTFDVRLREVKGAILLTVRDSGVSFDVDEAINNCGIDLISIRDRVSL